MFSGLESLFVSALSGFFLLMVGVLAVLPARRFGLPAPVLQLALGVGVAMFAASLANTGGFLEATIGPLAGFSLSPELVFLVVLPTLIFESAFSMRLSHLRAAAAPISLLATLSVGISLLGVGYAMHLIFGLPLLPMLVFGALISATDPVAVLAMLKNSGTPRRLRYMVEGESLLNDATSLVMFKLLLALAMGASFTATEGALSFLLALLGGLVVGSALGFGFSYLIGSVRGHRNVEMALTLVLAHATFLLAEYFGASGIIAVTAAGVIIGNFGRQKISPHVFGAMSDFWESMAFLVNAMVFVMIGISIAGTARADLWLVAVGAVIIVLVVRFASVLPALALANLCTSAARRVPLVWQMLIGHMGLRGALAVSMVLLLPPDFPFLAEITMATVSVVFFTLLFSGGSMRFLLKKKSITGFGGSSALEMFEGRALVEKAMQGHLKEMRAKTYIAQSVFEQLQTHYRRQEENNVSQIRRLMLKKEHEIDSDAIENMLRQHCLGIERQIFYALFAREEISESMLGRLVRSADRQLEVLESGEMPMISKPSSLPIGQRVAQKIANIKANMALFSHTTLGKNILRWALRREVRQGHQRRRARRVASWNVLKYLDALAESDLLPRKRVVEVLRKRYVDYHARAKKNQLELEAAFPEFLSSVEHFLAQRACLAMEHELLTDLYQRGILSDNVFHRLIAERDDALEELRRESQKR